MGCKTFNEQITTALQKTTLNGSDLFGVVENNTTYSITFDNLVTQLGVTGSLTDVSAGGATPVLASVAANNYNLRGIAAGRGTAIALDAQDNIEVRTQVDNAGSSVDGEAIIKDVTASSLSFKRIQAGAGVNVVSDTDSLIISNSDISSISKTVIISELADFPAAVAGVITLEGDTDYLIAGDISTSNTFVLPTSAPCVIRSADRRVVTLQSTTTGDMFTYTNPQCTIKNINISCPNGRFLAPSANTTGGIELFKISITADTLGTLTNLSVFAAQSITYTLISTNGWLFTGACGAAQFVSNFVVSVLAGTIIDLGTATFNRFGSSEFVIVSASLGTTWLSGAASNANLNTGVLGVVDQTETVSNITPLSTISTEDGQWKFSNSNAISDSITDALGYLSSPQTTTISASSTPVVINSNLAFTASASSQMSVNTSGRVTYNGVVPVQLPFDAAVTMSPSSGGSQTLSVYLAKNGVVIATTQSILTTSSGSPQHVSLIWQDEATTNDYYEVWVSNDSSTNNIDVDKFVFRIN